MRLDFIATPIKKYGNEERRISRAREISIKRLGISKVVIVRTKGNGGI